MAMRWPYSAAEASQTTTPYATAITARPGASVPSLVSAAKILRARAIRTSMLGLVGPDAFEVCSLFT